MNKRWKWSVWANRYTEILAKLWFEIIVICSFLHLCHIMMLCMWTCVCVIVYGYLLEVDSIVILWIVVLFWRWYEKYAFDSIVSAWCESNTHNSGNPNTFVSTIICLKSSNNCRVFFLPSFSVFLGYQLMFLPISLFMVLRLSFQLIEQYINKALSFDHN